MYAIRSYYAKRVGAEGARRAIAQPSLLQINKPAQRVEEIARAGSRERQCQGVDGEVAAAQVGFEVRSAPGGEIVLRDQKDIVCVLCQGADEKTRVSADTRNVP